VLYPIDQEKPPDSTRLVQVVSTITKKLIPFVDLKLRTELALAKLSIYFKTIFVPKCDILMSIVARFHYYGNNTRLLDLKAITKFDFGEMTAALIETINKFDLGLKMLTTLGDIPAVCYRLSERYKIQKELAFDNITFDIEALFDEIIEETMPVNLTCMLTHLHKNFSNPSYMTTLKKKYGLKEELNPTVKQKILPIFKRVNSFVALIHVVDLRVLCKHWNLFRKYFKKEKKKKSAHFLELKRIFCSNDFSYQTWTYFAFEIHMSHLTRLVSSFQLFNLLNKNIVTRVARALEDLNNIPLQI